MLTAGTLVIEMSNQRHRWELAGPYSADWSVFPESKTLAVGVVDSCSLNVGHEKTVADALIAAVKAIGDPSRVQATPDCGYGTMAGMHADPRIVERQLGALVKGTKLANDLLRLAHAAS
jgi:5-methyltetrahydropteroyltriglutamate--homocysteine methyltransferase